MTRARQRLVACCYSAMGARVRNTTLPDACVDSEWRFLLMFRSMHPGSLRELGFVVSSLLILCAACLGILRCNCRAQRACELIMRVGACSFVLFGSLSELRGSPLPLGMRGPWGLYKLSSTFTTVYISAVAVRAARVPDGALAELIRWSTVAMAIFTHELLPWSAQRVAMPMLCVVVGVIASRIYGTRDEKQRGGIRTSLGVAVAVASVGAAFAFWRLQLVSGLEAWRVAHTHWPLVALGVGAAFVDVDAPSSERALGALALVALAWAASMHAPGDANIPSPSSWEGVQEPGGWCCLGEFVRETDHDGRCVDGGWFSWREGREELPVVWDERVAAELPFTVLTNLTGLFGIVWSVMHRRAGLAVVGTCTMVSSSLYHFADTIDARVFGATEGNWHRIDNVFATMALAQAPSVQLESLYTRHTARAHKWFLIAATLVLQEVDPWNVATAIGPMALTHALLFAQLWRDRALRARLANSWTWGAVALMGVAFVCFAKGLDQGFDKGRRWHGMWHVAAGLGVWLMLCGTNTTGGHFKRE